MALDPLSILAKAGKIAAKVGEKVGKGTIKAGAKLTDKIVDGTVEGTFKNMKNFAKDRARDIGKAGERAAPYFAKEIKFQANALEYTKDVLTGEAPLSAALFGANSPYTKTFKKLALFRKTDENLLGLEATGLGKAFFLVGALGVGTKDAFEEWNKERAGYNDGTVYNNAPTMLNGQTFSSMGASYNDNAGATGDLGFALHNQRHTGYV